MVNVTWLVTGRRRNVTTHSVRPFRLLELSRETLTDAEKRNKYVEDERRNFKWRKETKN